MLSVERVSRILNQFNIAFTESAVLSFLNLGVIKKASRIESGGYNIDPKSLEQFLQENGVIKVDIKKVLP